MGAKVTSIGLKGLEGYRVTVEVQAMEGINRVTIVGLPDASVKESKERITAAFHSMDYHIFHKKIIINLSPSEQKKNGPLFDLPIAIGILKSMNEVPMEIPDDIGFLGALSLDGGLEPVEGMLPAVLAAKKIGIKTLYIPFDQKMPRLDFEGLKVIHVSSLLEIIRHLAGGVVPEYELMDQAEIEHGIRHMNFTEIIGHENAKRALEIAAAGGHHFLMSGPPGCGKSLLAESLPSIMPPMTRENWLEVLSIYQLNGLSYSDSKQPPFRNPHHSASSVAIIGGGSTPRPGEISLAHRGVLFLDEIAEFPKKTLEMLRQPLESGLVTISRVRSTVTYPSEFMLIGAMNPCPCGYLGSNSHYCTCSTKQIKAYQNRISGPIRDRFDIHLSLKSVELGAPPKKQEASETVRERVLEARERQFLRYGKDMTNSRVPYETLLTNCPIGENEHQLIRKLSHQHHWSNRRQIKIVRLAQTIADLNNQKQITTENIREATALSN